MTNNQSKMLTEDEEDVKTYPYHKIYYLKNKEKIDNYNLEYYKKNREKIAEKYRTKYVGADGVLTTYHREYYKKNKAKILKYYNDRYKTKGLEWYNNNKKEILLKKRQKYFADKNQPMPSLAKKKEEIKIDLSGITPLKSACQAKTNEIIKNLEILKIKAEAFKKSLNNN